MQLIATRLAIQSELGAVKDLTHSQLTGALGLAPPGRKSANGKAKKKDARAAPGVTRNYLRECDDRKEVERLRVFNDLLWPAVEGLEADCRNIVRIVNTYFALIQESLVHGDGGLFRSRDDAPQPLHSKPIDLTSKTRKEVVLIERQLQVYFSNLELDLKAAFRALNNFYELD